MSGRHIEQITHVIAVPVTSLENQPGRVASVAEPSALHVIATHYEAFVPAHRRMLRLTCLTASH